MKKYKNIKSLFLFLFVSLCMMQGCTTEDFIEENLTEKSHQHTHSHTQGRAMPRITGEYTYSSKVDLTLFDNNTINVYSKITDNNDVILEDPIGWENAVTLAIQDWNDANSCLKLNRVSNINDADIKIISFTDDIEPLVIGTMTPESVFGWSEDPSNGRPGEWIWINVNYQNANGPTTLDDKRNIIGHEIGHNIGFRHTDQPNGNLIIDDVAPLNSIMHSGILDRDITGLITPDKNACQALYAECDDTISGVSQLCVGAPASTYNWSGDDPVDDWLVTGNFQLSNESGFSVSVQALGNGAGNFRAVRNGEII